MVDELANVLEEAVEIKGARAYHTRRGHVYGSGPDHCSAAGYAVGLSRYVGGRTEAQRQVDGLTRRANRWSGFWRWRDWRSRPGIWPRSPRRR